MGKFCFAAAARAAAVVALGLPLAVAATSARAQVAAPGSAAMKPRATAPLSTYVGPRYDNRWELYGGLNYSNGQAGQSLPKLYNMGGVEVMGTYWLGNATVKKWGVAADFRSQAGTSQTGLIGAAYGLNRILVMQEIVSGGVQYRGPRGRYAAVDFHALGGGSYGIFDHAPNHFPGVLPVATCPAQLSATKPVSLNMYCNHMAPFAALGGSIDFNQSAKLAIRLQPDLILEHFGTETREFFSISAGVVYRFGGTAVTKKK